MSTAMQSINEQLKQELSQLGNTVAPPASRKISIKGKQFTLPDGTTHQGPMRAVILDHINFNAYYKKAYDPQNPAPPDCFALHKQLPEMAPHEESAEPQNADCATCPMNQFGSASTGKGKACRNKVRLAVAPANAEPDDEPMTIEVAPSSIKTWNSYVNKLKTQGVLPVQMITEVSFDPNSPYPVLHFKAVEMHEELEKFWAMREQAQALLEQTPAQN
jgi:hypothetical protein